MLAAQAVMPMPKTEFAVASNWLGLIVPLTVPAAFTKAKGTVIVVEQKPVGPAKPMDVASVFVQMLLTYWTTQVPDSAA